MKLATWVRAISRRRHPNRAHPRGAPGFVLVGVVMFVLALTILGLSLFGLSSFEAQFLGGSLDEAKAFHAAAGGIERAKFALVATDSLPAVKDDLPVDVVYAVALQDRDGAPPDSTGLVNWTDDQPLLIRVLAAHRGARKMLEARFTPRKPDNYYRRLITARDGVKVKGTGGSGTHPGLRHPQTFLVGDAWQQSTDESWNGLAQVPWDRNIQIKPLPLPDLDSFYAEHVPGAPPPLEPNPQQFDLTGGSGDVRYFWSPESDPQNADFSVFTPASNPEPTIDVTGAGVVVWMAEHGFKFSFLTHVVGSPSDCLVIVSKPNGLDPDGPTIGPWFFGGLDSPDVPVILVSNDEVRIEHFNYFNSSSQIGYVSVFARLVFLMGPISGSKMTLSHLPGAPEDAHGGLIDRLCELGALPNCGSTVAAAFPRVAGTWQQLNPDNPPEIP